MLSWSQTIDAWAENAVVVLAVRKMMMMKCLQSLWRRRRGGANDGAR